jgi:hypothetical protein
MSRNSREFPLRRPETLLNPTATIHGPALAQTRQGTKFEKIGCRSVVRLTPEEIRALQPAPAVTLRRGQRSRGIEADP